MSIFSKFIYRFDANWKIKNPGGFFFLRDKQILKFIRIGQVLIIIKTFY